MLLAKMFVQVPYFCLLPRCLCGNSRCVRLCALETHMDISQKKNAQSYKNNAAAQERGTCFVQVFTIEMHIDISQDLSSSKLPGNPYATTGDIVLCEPW